VGLHPRGYSGLLATGEADGQRLCGKLNGTLRAECLDAHCFSTMAEACQLIQGWKSEYNASRPHRALGERTPHEFARQIAASRDLSRLANAEH